MENLPRNQAWASLLAAWCGALIARLASLANHERVTMLMLTVCDGER